jgi:hypothetical protein
MLKGGSWAPALDIPGERSLLLRVFSFSARLREGFCIAEREKGACGERESEGEKMEHDGRESGAKGIGSRIKSCDEKIDHSGKKESCSCKTIGTTPDFFAGERLDGAKAIPAISRDDAENERDGEEADEERRDEERLMNHSLGGARELGHAMEIF